MRLTNFCIDRPVFASVLSLVIIVIGLMAYSQLELRFNPKIYEPHIEIQVTYPGASAALVEQSIVQPLENYLSRTQGLTSMRSQSYDQDGEIYLNFKSISKADFLQAQSEVLQQVSLLNLPAGAHKPKIKVQSSNWPILFFGISDPNKNMIELSNYVNDNVINPLQRVPGVSAVTPNTRQLALRITLDPIKMAKYGITIQSLKTTLDQNDLSVPLGSLVSKTQIITLSATSSLPDVDAFKGLVVKRTSSGQLVKLKDIAQVAVGPELISGDFSQLNGHDAITVSVDAKPDANPIIVGEAFKKALDQMSHQFPVGMKYEMLMSTSDILKSSVHEVVFTIFIAIVLVSLVSLLFLGRIRMSLIPFVTIPVCLIGSFIFIWGLGFSINIMTLLALVLATGLVVDDAIVVLENTYRHVQDGLPPIQAARKSLGEISFAVIAMTICLVAVYVPTAFMTGHTAVYFKEFSFTLAGAVLISGFVALTLTPMMCSRILSRDRHSRLEDRVGRVFDKFERGYSKALRRILVAKKWVVGLFIVLLIGGVFLFRLLPSALMPPFDMGFIWAQAQFPNLSSVDYSIKHGKPLFKKVSELPNVLNVWDWAGGTVENDSLRSMITLVPIGQRTDSSDEVIQQIINIGKTSPYASMYAMAIDPFSNNHSDDAAKGSLSFVLNGQLSYAELNKVAQNFVKRLEKSPLVQQADSGLKMSTQKYHLQVNRTLAAELGVSISEITNTLAGYIGGADLGIEFMTNDDSYPIVLQLPKKDLSDFSFLKQIFVKSSTGEALPISEFVSFKPVSTLSARYHYNQMRSAPMGLSLKPGVTFGQGVALVNQLAAKTLPAGITVQFRGKAKNVTESNQSMAWMFVLGLIFIYLILAALFESLIDPFVVILTVPLCIIGALAVLMVVPHGSLNVYTGVGLITLVGLISKHGILIVNFANQLRAEGKDLLEATAQAASIRLRPILMTTATMILGALPLVLSSGAGSNARLQIGMVIIAGLVVGTVFSLLIVPVAYMLLARFKRQNKACSTTTSSDSGAPT